jgi:hypothetical protein
LAAGANDIANRAEVDGKVARRVAGQVAMAALRMKERMAHLGTAPMNMPAQAQALPQQP